MAVNNNTANNNTNSQFKPDGYLKIEVVKRDPETGEILARKRFGRDVKLYSSNSQAAKMIKASKDNTPEEKYEFEFVGSIYVPNENPDEDTIDFD